MTKVQMRCGHHIHILIQAHAGALVQQRDRQVVGQALLVVDEHRVPADGQVRLFHQSGEVLHRIPAELHEVGLSIKIGLEPAAEGICT
ncbi:hypothetical protein D3C76_1646840 [compost metagenome]